MTKQELYTKIIEIYKKTGQGTSTYIMKDPEIKYLVKELISDGLFKIVSITNSTLPDDEFICLTKGYFSEEDSDTNSLTYMRIYMGLEKVIDLGRLKTLTLKESLKDPKLMANYSAWLTKNHKKLIEFNSIPTTITSKNELSKKEKDFLNSFDYFKKPRTKKETISELEDIKINMDKQFKAYDSLISLLKMSNGYENKLLKYNKEFAELKEEYKLIEDILYFYKNS